MEVKRNDLKEALKAGVTVDQMISDFSKQLADAEFELMMMEPEHEEKKQEEDPGKKTREVMVDAILTHMAAIGLIPIDAIEDNELREFSHNHIKELERKSKHEAPPMTMKKLMFGDPSASIQKEMNVDEVIEQFLKTLK